MDSRKLLVFISSAVVLLTACSANHQVTDVKPGYQPAIQVSRNLPPVPPPVIVKTSSFKKMDVFAGKTFTMRAEHVQVGRALFAICTDLGLNLIIDPGIDEEEQVTLNFTRTPADDALDIIMEMTGLFYEVRGNVLRVKKYATKMFSVPHIPSTSTFDSSLGGDVLGNSGGSGSGSGGSGGGSGGSGGGSGSGSDSGSSNLTGNFTLTYKRADGTDDFYAQLEENIASILGTGSSKGEGGDTYTLNKITGSLSIYTTRKKMTMVEKFLDSVFSRAVKEVQIEAKVVDVTLSDEWAYGIDWSTAFKALGGAFNLKQTLSDLGGAGTSGALSIKTDSFTAAINVMGKYGDVDTLSNPRLMVLNGQTALISAGTITPYWSKQSTTDTGINTNTTETYTKSNVLDGILLGVTPYINDDNTVTMNIIPVSTSIEGTKNVVDSAGNVVAEAPIVNVKEAGTIIRVDDGAMAVLGGLISTSKEVNNSRIPGLGDIPILGYLFRNESHKTMKRELVIFLKPTIVYTSGAAAR